MKHLLVASAGLPALVALGTSALGDHFRPLSPRHTNYGVSQLQYGDVAGSADFTGIQPVVRLNNPNHVTQAVAVLAYEAERGQQPGQPEVFTGCNVKVLTPHASRAVSGAEFPDGAGRPQYAVAIWAPLVPVTVGAKDDDDDDDNGKGKLRRTANGLGGAMDVNRLGDRLGKQINLAHPRLFSLPSDGVVPGQRQAAIDCVCGFVASLSLSKDTFSDFGISCP